MSVEQQVKTLAFAYVLTFFIIMITAYAVLSSLVVIRNNFVYSRSHNEYAYACLLYALLLEVLDRRLAFFHRLLYPE